MFFQVDIVYVPKLKYSLLQGGGRVLRCRKGMSLTWPSKLVEATAPKASPYSSASINNALGEGTPLGKLPERGAERSFRLQLPGVIEWARGASDSPVLL